MATKTRRSFSDRKKKSVVAFYKKHGYGAAAKRYRLAGSVIHRWVREQQEEPSPRSKQISNNGTEAVVLLRKAWKLIEKDMQAGLDYRPAFSYVRLALDTLTGEAD